ncbi:MAG: hypothetical protein CMJ81_09710 [Planctomycetaceae bacterium]|nr:hypothetical protein [Planctomycetaceae bacterium]
MTVDRADAHVHLFRRGYREGFTARPGVRVDEVACFESLAADHHVTAAFVVGYAAEDWCRENNRFLAEQLARHAWIYAVAFVAGSDQLTIERLESLRGQGFVGISLYLFDESDARLLQQRPDETWEWLVANRWLISVNSRGRCWEAWLPVLKRHGTLRVVISHLGLPPAVSEPPGDKAARQALDGPLLMANFPGPRIKLSAFYVLTKPGHDYPHEAAWPYVKCLRTAFGVDRLLWGSDYSPCLDSLTYPQTFTIFDKMPFFSAGDRQRIAGGNLHGLLAEARRS